MTDFLHISVSSSSVAEDTKTSSKVANDYNDDADDDADDDFMELPARRAKKTRFPPGCRVLAYYPADNNNDAETMYGRVQTVGIKYGSNVRDNLYKVWMKEKPFNVENVLILKEIELQYAPFTPVWLQMNTATNSMDGGGTEDAKKTMLKGIVLSSQHYSEFRRGRVSYKVQLLENDNHNQPMTGSSICSDVMQQDLYFRYNNVSRSATSSSENQPNNLVKREDTGEETTALHTDVKKADAYSVRIGLVKREDTGDETTSVHTDVKKEDAPSVHRGISPFPTVCVSPDQRQHLGQLPPAGTQEVTVSVADVVPHIAPPSPIQSSMACVTDDLSLQVTQLRKVPKKKRTKNKKKTNLPAPVRSSAPAKTSEGARDVLVKQQSWGEEPSFAHGPKGNDRKRAAEFNALFGKAKGNKGLVDLELFDLVGDLIKRSPDGEYISQLKKSDMEQTTSKRQIYLYAKCPFTYWKFAHSHVNQLIKDISMNMFYAKKLPNKDTESDVLCHENHSAARGCYLFLCLLIQGRLHVSFAKKLVLNWLHKFKVKNYNSVTAKGLAKEIMWEDEKKSKKITWNDKTKAWIPLSIQLGCPIKGRTFVVVIGTNVWFAFVDMLGVDDVKEGSVKYCWFIRDGLSTEVDKVGREQATDSLVQGDEMVLDSVDERTLGEVHENMGEQVGPFCGESGRDTPTSGKNNRGKSNRENKSRRKPTGTARTNPTATLAMTLDNKSVDGGDKIAKGRLDNNSIDDGAIMTDAQVTKEHVETTATTAIKDGIKHDKLADLFPETDHMSLYTPLQRNNKVTMPVEKPSLPAAAPLVAATGTTKRKMRDDDMPLLATSDEGGQFNTLRLKRTKRLGI